jgi:hypothetical protein
MARAYQNPLREGAVAFESQLDDVLAGLEIELLECSVEVVDDSCVVAIHEDLGFFRVDHHSDRAGARIVTLPRGMGHIRSVRNRGIRADVEPAAVIVWIGAVPIVAVGETRVDVIAGKADPETYVGPMEPNTEAPVHGRRLR